MKGACFCNDFYIYPKYLDRHALAKSVESFMQAGECSSDSLHSGSSCSKHL